LPLKDLLCIRNLHRRKVAVAAMLSPGGATQVSSEKIGQNWSECVRMDHGRSQYFYKSEHKDLKSKVRALFLAEPFIDCSFLSPGKTTKKRFSSERRPN
jgi:hypothetical protein